MNTELVSRTGTVPEQMIPTSPGDVLEGAVEYALAAVRPSERLDEVSNARQAEESLVDALRRTEPSADDALEQAVACAEAAAEHLRYGEFQEARLLLVAARGQLVRSHTRRR
ncbi:hypothetical protein ABZ816_18065 [Actinosynnema sp. NPDC047251]|uniref:Uncharacterized protein n=1 Tax=Saccharothrix espanaensis (strain ATCC 51144 / DSM 44229 / JCM 9112 / NBRC 15066 / NRRL 15764) TaxID=1179773 RepID=K0K9C2_SACES|nr:hypothetical protein [Saccharothrix espanaensis]CCH33434.1 hypothetical protein BN6_61830 [Saccharothrix espanaensis DSM 44229]